MGMGIPEALSDDGKLTGRGAPLLRGIIWGLMTVLGGLGHTLPFLFSSFTTATVAAMAAVILELGAIVWIRWRWQRHTSSERSVAGGSRRSSGFRSGCFS